MSCCGVFCDFFAKAWNGSEIGASLGVSHHAVRRYLDALTGACMLRQPPPWFASQGKRVVKSPKVYLRDSGLLHALLDINAADALADLNLERLWIVYPGHHRYSIHSRVECIGLDALPDVRGILQ